MAPLRDPGWALTRERDPLWRMFGGLPKLGPGDDALTAAVLGRMPHASWTRIVDAGCGSGRQTLVLADVLRRPIDCVDLYRPFLDELEAKAADAGLSEYVSPKELDMGEIPGAFAPIDLLWCESAAYGIGFERAVSLWRPAMRAGGHLAISDLTWLSDAPSERARGFFSKAYPAMRDIDAATVCLERHGWEVLETHTLPRAAWFEGLYDVLEPRATALATDEDPDLRALATGLLEEIDVFRGCPDEYGYVLHVCRVASS